MGYIGRRIGLSQDTATDTGDGAGGGLLDLFSNGYFQREGNVYNAPGEPPTGLTATGGVISDYTDGSEVYRAHVFTSSGAFNVTALSPSLPNNVDYLVVGGGGGGSASHGGGGGAGGLRTATGISVAAPTSYAVVIGAGAAISPGDSGVQGNDGNPSSIAFSSPITSGGGGGAGTGYPSSSTSGRDGIATNGNGGGAGGGGSAGSGGSGNGAGNDGGGRPPTGGNSTAGAGGGGGGAGANGSPSTSGFAGGNGGAGSASVYAYGPTNPVTYAGGGGGAGWGGAVGSGGAGGGGTGRGNGGEDGENGDAGTGGGGGGSGPSSNCHGGAGGSGIVIVRYRIP